MSKRNRSNTLDYLVYLAVRWLVCVVQALPPEFALQCARLLAWVAYKLDKRHRFVAIDNLRQAFPGRYSDAEIDQLVRRIYLNLCTLLVEIVSLPRKFHLHNYKQRVRFSDAELFADLMLSGRPIMFVTGHFGNWEMAGYALAMFGFPSCAIARPLDNPYLDEYLRGFREATGQKLIAKGKDFDALEEVLATGGVLATLADQDAGRRGLFVDFFGRPASTHKGVALLSLQHQVPLVVCGMPKVNGIYEIQVIDVIYPEDYVDAPDAIRAITQRFTTGLETLIRAAPEQYFWLHRRWKHEPGQRAKRSRAA